MLLKSIEYSEYSGTNQEWILEHLPLGTRNLLVGKNATGKTRCLNLIGGLSKLLSGEWQPSGFVTGNFKVIFEDGQDVLEYVLEIHEKCVTREVLVINGKTMLARGADGAGEILAEKINQGIMIEFQSPQDELAAFVRRDSRQHSFLERLYLWGHSTRHYHFGTSLGKENFALLVKKNSTLPDGKNPGEIIGVFLRAKRDFPDLFERGVLRDMDRVGYPIDSINVGPLVSVRYEIALVNEVVAIRVQEKNQKGLTDQAGMSQGMFRVLSILILINYMECKQQSACLVIDDLGEGLDFERSCLLIDLLREKTEKSKIQLIISSNDKFVMNEVPIVEWSFLQRSGGTVRVRNVENSRELFEEFRFTGLSNFSFLEMDFANGLPAEEPAAHE
ncbi:AAA family ATPase [Fimbriiglobus ruber]|uniref:AAA family ATPase n=1 Tax=Fimbriiglobus ruber TaxID=1908690 RepID=UPI000B4B87FB|nr:AAA family ATPase [Fimbriiglobus ruber]